MKVQEIPIKSELKSKRIKGGASQNFISKSFMKEVRENNKTRKIYDVNPYVEVYQYRENVYALFADNCDGAGDMWMFLIIGPEKAMLIDTGYGLGDTKALVDEITGGKPIIVINTHGHCDHAYGNCRFDKVFCHEYEEHLIKAQDSHIWDYLFDENGNNIWLEFDKNDLPVFKEYELEAVKDGHIFNLGEDYDVELVWLGGHAAGNSGILDKQSRIFFPGDDICSDVSGLGRGAAPGTLYREYMTITTVRNQFAKLVERLDEFDYIFPSHFMINIENSLLPNMLDACNEIIANPSNYDYKLRSIHPKGGHTVERLYKFVKGFGSIAYTPEGV